MSVFPWGLVKTIIVVTYKTTLWVIRRFVGGGGTHACVHACEHAGEQQRKPSTDVAQHVLNPQHALTEVRLPKASKLVEHAEDKSDLAEDRPCRRQSEDNPKGYAQC